MSDTCQAKTYDRKTENAAAPLVLLGVTGCIAAYKSCEVLRGLQKAGVRVKVVMTKNACEFVGPTTFRALTHEPVAIDTFGDGPGDPIHHVSLAEECDLFLIAPCTANVLAKMAAGIADDLLSTTALACTAPIAVAPAMNVHMYEAVATRHNMQVLASRGVHFIEPSEGYLACGDVGRGRLADPVDIVASVLGMLGREKDLEGRHVVVTAGPTVEPIDAVRFISNPSTGKMGFAIAESAVERGAEVTLVTGPVSLADVPGAKMVRVGTACEMKTAVDEAFSSADIAVFSAAVSDFRPRTVSDRKLKKGADDDALVHIELVENPDILASCGAAKREGQVVVGFAAETNDVIGNARSKLSRKKADFIVANDVSSGRGFGTDSDEVAFVSASGEEHLPEMGKRELADRILDKALEFLK
ncbi:bifunctional phosphopantothenoylcysteine decarboxylase/phosphopantothenate--cysteine ligase CoaBC [uncultured Ellagibacter sp.]|uniref:bifunctional phosphopantothenoylcysteine decarboxylase/phosphopantothenate--cysteine ligase CoaBC n=1 Tax=uncultured Ellagibacter sp. TaxID=2137580 RepID=UPI002620D440|nr:bifunctional phosphopantothenoylcysteine decarboxylase/phosphopantothenate--cysteine ligase CoaBC [uncultured Ellagibacter sp.]